MNRAEKVKKDTPIADALRHVAMNMSRYGLREKRGVLIRAAAAIDEMQAENDRLNQHGEEMALRFARRAHELYLERLQRSDMQAEIDRLKSLIGAAYCQKVGADAANGLGACDDFKNWMATLERKGSGDEPTKAMAELQKEAQERAVMAHIQKNFPPLPEGAGDYFLDGDRWVRCNDSGPL